MSGSIKDEKYSDQLRDYQILKKNSVPWTKEFSIYLLDSAVCLQTVYRVLGIFSISDTHCEGSFLLHEVTKKCFPKRDILYE
jgi:hypothetical protein